MSAALTFVLAMVMYPEIQRKAQKQLDDVVGDDRLPHFSDRSQLPYIDAVLRESLRWQQVLPMGVAHALIADDEYRGYFIPKGTVVIANQWFVPFNHAMLELLAKRLVT